MLDHRPTGCLFIKSGDCVSAKCPLDRWQDRDLISRKEGEVHPPCSSFCVSCSLVCLFVCFYRDPELNRIIESRSREAWLHACVAISRTRPSLQLRLWLGPSRTVHVTRTLEGTESLATSCFCPVCITFLKDLARVV